MHLIQFFGFFKQVEFQIFFPQFQYFFPYNEWSSLFLSLSKKMEKKWPEMKRRWAFVVLFLEI